MPYSEIGDLPKGVRNNLPKKAQNIYREAFNNAWQDHSNDESHEEREERSHRIAWAAVKQNYERSNSGWHRKSE